MIANITIPFGGFDLTFDSSPIPSNRADVIKMSISKTFWRHVNEDEAKKGDEGKKELVRVEVCTSELKMKQAVKELSDLADLLVILSKVDA